MRVTNDKITTLNPNEIFVFGSNESGIHGAGAAKLAYQKFGAVWGVGYGLQGQSFALPSKDKKIMTMTIPEIDNYVRLFVEFAKTKSELNFLVTAIGTGLAGYKHIDIAPLFKEAFLLENVYLPKEFNNILLENVV